MGAVFQDFRLLPGKTVTQNVAFALQVIGKPRHAIRTLVPETLEMVGLADKGKRLPHELSGGEQQRVAIARAVVNKPQILLADEPTGNLDPATSLDIVQLLDRINRTGTTIVMATHDSAIVNEMRRRVIELQEGRVVRDVAEGTYTPERTTAEPASQGKPEAPVSWEPEPEEDFDPSAGYGWCLMRLGFILGEIWTGLRRNLSMAISVILVTMVSVFLLGLGMLAQRQADTMKGYWYDRIQVSIYMCTEGAPQPNCNEQAATDDQKATIESQLKAMPEVDQVFREDAQEAFDRFREQFRNSPIADTVQVGDIPESFRVKLKDPTKFAVVSSQFEGAPGVASVQDQEKVLKKFFQIINGVTVFALGLASLMAVCAALLMATTIRQAAFVRRRDQHHAARRCQQLDDPDALHHRDAHRGHDRGRSGGRHVVGRHPGHLQPRRQSSCPQPGVDRHQRRARRRALALRWCGRRRAPHLATHPAPLLARLRGRHDALTLPSAPSRYAGCALPRASAVSLWSPLCFSRSPWRRCPVPTIPMPRNGRSTRR
jgi:energy-coupling factor transporter ATP-binding protein EcfA2